MRGSSYRKQLRSYIKSRKQRACQDCGKRYPDAKTSYDHVRGIKRFCLGGSVNGLTMRDVKIEISKCDVVCLSCHRAREAARARGPQQVLVG